MRMRRLLAVLLLLSMLVSVVPTSVFAVETENGSDGETAATAVDPSTAPSDNLFVDKTVTLTEDGTYSINMEAYATGTPITKTVELGVPLDVVLVVDQSGSLKNSGSVDSMKNSIRDFMNALKANGEAVGVDHRVSICSFAGDDLGGLSGPANETYGYSFAGDLWDLAWLNTGLYVDGKFQDYGTVEYTRIDSQDNLDETRSYLVKYTRPLENGSSVTEYFRIYYYDPYGSWYINNGKQGLVSLATREQDGNDKTTSEELITKYEVYDIGKSTLQLDQADYAASWEYIADGQGNLNADVAAAINSLASNGGTRTSYGLKMARNMLKYITPGTDNDIRKKVVVVFTDGKAGSGWDNDGEMAATLAEANKIKDSGVDIYTVGVYNDAVATDIASFMNQFSSNCGVIEFSENPTTEYENHKLDQDTWANSVTGRYRTLPSFYKVENEDGTVEFCPVRVRVETRYSDAAKGWVVTPPYKWTYITDTGEMPIPDELLNEDGTAITGLYEIGSSDYNSEAGYYQTSNSFDNLSSLFQTVLDKETIFYSEVELGTTAILKDVLADGFTLTDNTQITVSVVPGSVSEENSNLSPNELTSDKITWSEEAQQVLTFNYKEAKEGTGNVIVTGAADQMEMTLTATAENGEINVTGYNYAEQYIGKDHAGSKLVVTITGVEAAPGVTTNAATSTNKATSGVYEGPESDADKDGIPGEIETPFPVPNTYLTSEYYYLDETGKVTFEIKDFLMDEGINISDGYHFFNTAEPGTTLATEYGTVTVKGDGTVTYQLKEGVELEKDIIYLFGKTEDATVKAATANANGNMWSEITILPPKDAVGKLHTDKSATLTDNGTYTIDLEAFATGTPAITALAKGVPLDVVLVLDQSASLAYRTVNGVTVKDGAALAALKASVSSFVHELQANGDANGLNHRISICGFGSDVYWSRAASDELWNLTYSGGKKTYIYTNTGLFVNGEFRNYGKVEYTKIDIDVNNLDDAKELEKIVDNKGYWAKRKDGNGPDEMLHYYPGTTTMRKWITGGWDVIINLDNKADILRECLEIYDLYEIGTEFTYLSPEQYKNSWQNVSDGQGNLNPNVAKAIDSLAANGGTYTSYGLRMARHMLANNPLKDDTEREKVVIVFTDGKAGGNNDSAGEMSAALAEAKKIKGDNVEIYAIGVYNESTAKSVENFMNQLSSNCNSHTFSKVTTASLDYSNPKSAANGYEQKTQPYFYYDAGTGNYYPIKVYWTYKDTDYTWYYITDEGEKLITGIEVGATKISDVYKLDSGAHDTYLGYYSNSNDFNDMPGLFREIVTEVSTYSSEVQLDAKAILKDVMADGFTLTNNTQITVSVVPGSVKEQFAADVGAKRLGSEHIAWGTPQKVLTFKYSEAKEGTGNVIVNGAADQTEMTLSAQVTEDGIITVTGFNYAAALDNHKENAQYICAGHPGSKLVVTITGVEAKNGVTTDSFTVTNKGASGIYEASDSDMDGDGTFGEMQAYFPIPTTYLSSKTYYVDYSGELIIDPADFLMTIKGYSLDKYGYHGFGAPGTIIEMDHGTVTVLDDGKLKFTMKPDGLGITDTFYLFGHTDNATVKAAMANTTGNMWSKVTIITPEDITGKLFLDKEATLTGDGTYTIDLNAYATGTPASTIIKDGIPLDVVLVIDQSGSLFSGDGGGSLETLKSSVTSFIEALKTNGEAFGVNHRVSICGFASAAKQGASGVKYYGLSYANNIQDNAWINTGLFVNGQFKDYGTLEYIPVERVDDIVSSRYYAVEHDFDKDGIMEISRTYVRNDAWVVSSGTPSGTQYITLAGVTKDADGNVTATANENLFNNYKVYTVGDSSNLLTDADYAASWENVADGLNGQGNINADITKTIDSLAASGATATFYGLKMAARMLANVPDDGIERKRVVIVFTDGVPGYNGYTQGDGDAALSEVMKIKETDAEVYAVGIYKASSAASVETFMNQLSSNYVSHSFTTEPIQMDMAKAGTGSTFLKYTRNIDGSYYGISPYFHKVVNDDGTEDFWPISVYYDPTVDQNLYHAAYITDDAEIEIASGAKNAIPGLVGDVYMLAEPVVNDHPDADYYKYSTNIDDLTAIFKAITTDATTFASETALGVDAVLKDVMASNFVLTDNTTVTVSVVPGSVKEEYANLTADELTEAHIDWSAPQQVLTFKYSEEKEGTGKVIVTGAADQTEMTLTAKVDENGVITVTGYNYADPADNHKENAQYICAGHPGSKLVVTITGVEAQSNVVTDSFTVTNKGASGIYEGPNSDMDGDGEKGEIQSSFPVPTTYMASKVYVVDYAKTMTINPADFKMTVGAVSVDVDGYNHFDPAVTAVTGTYGKVTVEGGKITYTPTKTNWNGYDTFYVFGTTDNATIKAATANENGNMWAKVSVVPANNVYYEDTFVTNEDTGVVGIVFGGVWEEVKEAVDAGANGENAESGESTTKDDQGNDHQGGVHGWEDNLADDTGFSDGGAHVAGTDGKTGATATFTFTGTGVDIYTRTNDKTGMVIAMLYEGTSTTGEDGKNLVAKYSLMVDNLAASGDYYQIPTLSFYQIPKRDEDGKIIKDKETGETEMMDLPYGTYTVKITVSKANASQTGEVRTLYYLDGIRVYNPIQDKEGDSTVSGAYGEKELNANFVEIRDKLLDANSFSAEIDKSAGPVFIDRITSEDGSHTDNTTTVEIGTYKVFGPKNEVYLSAEQIVAFAVPYTEGAHYYIGMKSLTGKTVKVIPNSTNDYVNLIVVGHTTDQYYEIVPEWEYDEHGNPTTGIIYVHADKTSEVDGAGAILALTKLKVTGPKAKNFEFARVSNDKLLEMIAEDLAPSLDMDDTNSSPDVGGNTPNKPNVDINKPSSDTTVDEQTALKNLMIDLLTRIFSDLRGWFKS